MKSRRAWVVRLAVVLLAFATVAGCDRFSNGTAVLATNLPHLIPYVERFNAQFDEYKISIRYVEAPDIAGASGAGVDLLAGFGLNSVTRADRFTDLASVLEEIGSGEYYEGLLDLGRIGESQLLLPLSFSLPAIMMSTDDAERLDPALIDIDELRSLSASFSDSTDRMGFVPRWDIDSAYLVTRIFGVDYHETDQALPAWNDVRLGEAVAYIHSWTEELNGGADTEEEFARKFLYDPAYRLVAEGRIRFAGTSLEAFLNVPGEIRERLDVRWLSREGRIPVDERVAFIGRLRSSRNRRTAEAFLTWFFDPDTKAVLLEADRYRRVRGFGIAGGFSSLKRVNSETIPRLYPELADKIPGETALDFPDRLPTGWPILRSEVVEPWLLEQSRSPGIETPLGSRILDWQRQQPVSPGG